LFFVEPLWLTYAKAVDTMSDYAEDFRYPGHSATWQEAKIAFKHCRSLRVEVWDSKAEKGCQIFEY